MSPPTFHIGDDVEVIGPSITGNDIHLGKRFKIECMYVNPSQHIQFEPYDGTYYPASSLRLVEPELKIGDFAEVILPDNPFTGKIGQVSSIGKLTVALYDMGIWSRGNLRKLSPAEVEKHLESELKIGDLVRIVGPGWRDNRDEVGQSFRVESYHDEFEWHPAPGMNFYPATSLRKLTPKEIKQHTNPGKQYPITPAKDFDELTLRDVARMAGICKNEYGVWISTLLKRAHETEDRLSAIEKQLKEFDGEISHLMGSIQECLMESGDVETRTRCRAMAIERRLDFVEKFQRGQAEYRRNMLWMEGP